MATVAEKRAAFRKLHDHGFFLLPNAWDVGSAVRLQAMGFRAIASTSAGAAWAVGKKDGELTLAEVLDHLRMLVGATDLPVNADFENGFAHDPEQVATNVREAVATGVAGLSIEDWSGTAHYDVALAVDRIAAARGAIDATDPQTMLIGRCEQFRAPDAGDGAYIERAAAYARAGADCLFVPMMTDHGAIAELIVAVAPKPVSVLLPSPDTPARTFADLGVRRCSTGGALAAAAWAAFDRAAQKLDAGLR